MKKHLALWIAIVVPRLPLLWSPLLHVDEAIFATGTHVWLSGGIPYVDFVETKALGVYLFYALGALLGGSAPHVNMIAVHALTILWAWGTALAIRQIGARLHSTRVGWTAAFFFAAASTSFIPEFVCPNIECVLLLPWTAAVAVLAHPRDRLASHHLFWSGVFTAAAILCKYQAGVLLVAIVLFLLTRCCVGGMPWRRIVRLWGWYTLGLLPLPLLMLWYLHAQQALAPFLYWNFHGSAHYIVGGNALIDVWSKVAKKFLPYIAATAILWYLVGWRALRGWREWKVVCTVHRGRPVWTGSLELLLWLWLAGALVAVAVGKRFFDHYFLLLTPPLALVAARATVDWLAPTHPKRRLALVLFLVVSTTGFTMARFVVHPLRARLHIEDMATYATYGQFLRERTTPAERVLVWGYSPAVYWYAHRLPATRFMWSDLLVGRIPGAPNNDSAIRRAPQFVNPRAWDDFLQDLAKHRPAYILDMAPTGLHYYEAFPMTQYPRMMAFVRAHYELQGDFQGASVWQRRE